LFVIFVIFKVVIYINETMFDTSHTQISPKSCEPPQILGNTVPNFVTWATWGSVFVHYCCALFHVQKLV